MRICSFLPSATEIVYALGLGDALEAVSHECDYPPEAKAKPRVVKCKFDPVGYTSQEIDRLVGEMMKRGEPIYEVDLDVLERARPDIVITQQLCDVCAIPFEDVQRAVARLEVEPQLISLDPHNLEDVLGDIGRLGRLTGREERARDLTSQLKGRIETVRAGASPANSSPRVACIEWIDPLIVAGHWVSEIVQLAGGLDELGQPGAPSRRIQMGELIEYRPEVVVLMPCGMGVERAIQEFSLLENPEQWNALPAVQNDRIYAADAGSLYSRSGPRLVEGLEIMAQMIHPEVFTGALPEIAAKRLGPLPVRI